jgi:hypothetical protein
MTWTTDASCSCRKEVSWVLRVTMVRERRRRKRKTNVLTAQYGDVARTQAKSRDDGHPDGPESPLGGRGQWSTCSSTPARLIGSVLCGCRMDRSQKLSPCDAISFQGDRLVWLLIDPLGTVDDGADLITGTQLGSCRSLHLPHPSSPPTLQLAPIFTSLAPTCSHASSWWP